MHISVSHTSVGKDKTTISIVHEWEGKEYKIDFSGNTFGKKIVTEGDIFSEVNKLFSIQTPAVLNSLFETYVKIKRLLDDIWKKDDLNEQLTNYVTDLYSVFNYEKVREWVSLYIHIPGLETNFASEYLPSMDDVGSRDQTYLRSDYIDLIAMNILLKLMVPIWNQFIDSTRREYGPDFKEFYAFKLLRNTELYHCRAMEKLRTYISFPMRDHLSDAEMIMKGLSSEDILPWMLSLVVLRRLVINKIENVEDPSLHLITHIYKFVFRKSQASKTSGTNSLKDKKIRKNESEDEKESSLDRYKIKFNVSAGEIAEIEYVLTNHHYLINKYCPNINPKIVEDNIRTAQNLRDVKLEDSQLLLLSWIVNASVPARSLIYVSKEILLQAIGVAQSIFWELDYKFLSFLVSAYPQRDNEKYIVTSSETKYRVTKELDELNQFFPYYKRSGRRGTAKPVNPVTIALNKMVTDFSSINWLITAKEKYIKEVYGEHYTRQLAIPADLKITLVKCLIDMLKIQYTK